MECSSEELSGVKYAATKVAPFLGMSGPALVLAATTVMSIGAAVWQNVTRFDAGYEAAVEDLKEGSVELDGKAIEIKTEADKEFLNKWKGVIDAEEHYHAEDDKRVTNLENTVNWYRRKLNDAQRDRKNDPKTYWDDVDLPAHERLRFDNLNREREGNGDPNSYTPINDKPGASGYPAPNTLAGSADRARAE